MSLNVAARALTTNQSVLQVIGHNISNANTVGYSRQSVSLDSVTGQKLGNGYFGKGVELTAVKRSYDAFLTKQANSTQAVASADEVRFQKMQQVEALFPLGVGSLGSLLNTALNAWVDVQASPTDSTARQVVIDKADEFAARVRDTFTRLNEIGQTARLQAAEVTRTINQYATQIAGLNGKVVDASATGVPPNDLLDQRDQLLADLNKLIKVSTIQDTNGSITVFAASSQPLVLGKNAASLEVEPDPSDPNNRQIVNFLQNGAGSRLDPDFLGGGELAGLQQFINNDLNQAMGELGRMALATAVEINLQHQSGLKSDGTLGGRFFGFSVPVTPASSSFALQFQSTGLAADDYVVNYTAANAATVQRLSDGKFFNDATDDWETAATNINLATYSANTPLVFDGVRLEPTAAGTAGSQYRFAPAREAARSLSVNLATPRDVAAASAVGVTPATANTGTGVIESYGISLKNESGGLPAPLPTFNLTYNAATASFAIGAVTNLAAGVLTPAANVAYVPGQPMTITYTHGTPAREFNYEIKLRGQPATGDVFNVVIPTTMSARFSGGNAGAMLALRDRTVLDGSVALSDAYVAAFSGVASALNESKVNSQFSAAQASQAETQRANVAGVNLDEEAAMLIQYQQAYQASAKYMGTVQGLFDTLMSAFR
ncbi:MAG TPA: flagellar hook-associated protein FlgK [Burkholderiaceae bacterium]|nr:flagellar hook-associated protein FlgK [Burkholderiaceae bacterium]